MIFDAGIVLKYVLLILCPILPLAKKRSLMNNNEVLFISKALLSVSESEKTVVQVGIKSTYNLTLSI